MVGKPSEKEEEYFARIEYERKKKIEEEKQQKIERDEKERLRELHSELSKLAEIYKSSS